MPGGTTLPLRASATVQKPPATRRASRATSSGPTALVSAERGISSAYGCRRGRHARIPRTSISPSPGKCRSSRAVRMMPAIVGGTCCSASQTWAKRNHSRGSLRARRDSSRSGRNEACRSGCRIRSDSPPARHWSPRQALPVSVQCGNSRLTKMPSGFARSQSFAKRAVARSRSGSGSCAMMLLRAELGGRLEFGAKSSGPSVGSMRKSSTSSTSRPGIVEPRLRFPHQRPVARQVVQRLGRW